MRISGPPKLRPIWDENGEKRQLPSATARMQFWSGFYSELVGVELIYKMMQVVDAVFLLLECKTCQFTQNTLKQKNFLLTWMWFHQRYIFCQMIFGSFNEHVLVMTQNQTTFPIKQWVDIGKKYFILFWPSISCLFFPKHTIRKMLSYT